MLLIIYILIDYYRLENPCLDGIECTSPYGFHNQLPLTEDSQQFAVRLYLLSIKGAAIKISYACLWGLNF